MRSWGDSRTCRASVIRDILRGRLAADPDPHGLRLRGARISGQLDLEYLTTNVSFELSYCLLEEGILARDAQLASVTLTGCRLEQPLYAARLACSVLILDSATIIGRADVGAVNLAGAHIGGQLDCRGAQLTGSSGDALVAVGLKVRGDVFLDSDALLHREFTVAGAVQLYGADITGTLSCDGAHLEGRDSAGNALAAERLKVGRDVFLRKVVTIRGAVRLYGADITGNLRCDGAHLEGRDSAGNALAAERLKTGGAVHLDGGFTAAGAVRLYGADITGDLRCRGGFTATGRGDDDVTVDLKGTRVGGTLVFAPAKLTHAADSDGRLAVDGLTYAGVPQQVTAREWLGLLRDGTRCYAAQPYQQLAAGYRALGDERQARQILMAQRDDRLARTQPRPSRPERLWGRITKVTLGYGYQPWRALLFLAGVVVVSCVLAVVLGSHGALAQTDKTATPGQPCTVIQQVSVGLDLNLPVGTSVARPDCDLARDPGSAAAAWVAAAGWMLRVLAWAFAALFIAGFTSAVRKT